MTSVRRHTIIVKTPQTGGFVRVKGQVIRDFYSYKWAESFDYKHIFYEGDDTWFVLIEGQNIPYAVAKALVRAAVCGQTKITKFQDFL